MATILQQVHQLQDCTEPLAVQLGSEGQDTSEIDICKFATLLPDSVVKRGTAVFLTRSLRKRTHEIKVKLGLTNQRALPNKTIIEMELHGLSHRTLDGVRVLAPPRFFRGHSTLCLRSKKMINQSETSMPRPTRGRACSITTLLQCTWGRTMPPHSEHREDGK
jgi:hypothetical protein